MLIKLPYHQPKKRFSWPYRHWQINVVSTQWLPELVTSYTTKQYSKFSLHLISSLIFIIGISAGSYLTIANVLIPAIRALTETTQSMPADVLFTATGHDNGSGTITVLDTEIKLATSSSWWSGEYAYQQPVTVKNLAAIAASQSAQIQLDTQTLISQSKLQNDCDDLRLTYDRYEIPRSIQNCNTPATTITFPLQDTLSATASSSAYALYYGHPTAAAPSFPKEKTLYFEGDDKRVLIPNSSSLNPGFSDFSLAFWFKGSVPADWTTIIHKPNWNESSFEILKRSALIRCGGVSYEKMMPDISDNVWHQIVVSFDRSNDLLHIYKDGIEYGTPANISAESCNIQNSSFLTFAYSYHGSARLIGQLDDIRMYLRPLSVQEALNLATMKDVSSNELVGHWKLDELSGQIVQDVSNYGNHGYLGSINTADIGDPVWINNGTNSLDINGKHATLICPFMGTTTCVDNKTPSTSTGAIRFSGNSALQFDGTNDYIELNSALSLPGSFSLSMWVKPLISSGSKILFSHHVSSNEDIYMFLSNGNPQLQIYQNGVYKRRYLNAPIPSNQFSHLVGVYDGTNLNIYVNGVLAPGDYIENGYFGILSAIKTTIGARISGTPFPFHGIMDDVAVYNRAITTDEITRLYNSGNSNPIQSDSSTKLLLHFDENGDDARNTGKVFDASGNGNHGTINGAKYVNDSPVPNSTIASHQGVFIEEATTNRVVNPSFENNITDGWIGKSDINFTASQQDADGNYLLGSNTIKDVYYYDTTKDTDGGAWRNNATAQTSSWYNEPFSTTRGKKREFPEKAYIIATESTVEIIDASENKLWMRFIQNPYSYIYRGADPITTASSVHAQNGELYVGIRNGNDVGGLSVTDFTSDSNKVSIMSGNNRIDLPISGRNNMDPAHRVSPRLYPSVRDTDVNDVHTAVIGGKTYVAVATDGGVSLINETDGTVVHFYSTNNPSYNKTTRIFITTQGNMYFNMDQSQRILFSIYKTHPTWNTGTSAMVDSNAVYSYEYTGSGAWNYAAASTPALVPVAGNSINAIFVTEGTSTVDGTSNTIYVGSANGLTILQEKQGDESNGSVKYYTKDMISEEMVGDIRGMWDFSRNTTLSSNDQVEDASAKDTDLISVGGATVVDGVRGKAFQFNGSSQYLKQKIFLTETGSTWGPITHNLSLANGSAFFRAGETLGNEVVNSPGFEIAGTGGADLYSYWYEDPDNGTITDETTLVKSGSHAVKLSNGNNTRIYSTFVSTPGQTYELSFWTRGDGVNAGRYLVYDITHNVPIKSTITTNINTNYYQQVKYVFTAPAGTNSIGYYFYSPISGSAYFDDISIKPVTSPNLSTYKGTDAGSTPYMIAVKDSANKTAWGYLGNSEVGETLGSELETNTGFETAGSGGADVFGTWTESAGDGQIDNEGVIVNSGTHALKLTSGSSVNTMIYGYKYSLTPGKLYKLSVFTRGDGNNAGRYYIWDMTNSSYIKTVTSTNIIGSSYQLFTQYFTVPAGCNGITYGFHGPSVSGSYAYFDDVSVKEVTDTQIDGVHIMSTRNGTTRNWAGIETGFNYNDTAYTFEVRKSDFQLTGSFTMGAWVNASVLTGTQVIMRKDNASTNNESIALRHVAGSGFQYKIYTTNTNTILTSSGGAANSSTWYHLVAKYDGSNAYLYVNGINVGQSAATGLVKDISKDFTIGESWNGTIDEPFVTAEALTDAQILSMYQKGLGALNHANKTEQKLAGTSNIVSSVWASGNLLYAATSTVNGAVSVIDMSQDSVTKFFSTASTPALLSNDSLSMAIAGSHATTPTLIVGSNTAGVTNLNSHPTTASRVTTTPKFDAASLKLDNSTATMSATYTFSDTLTVNPYTLSAYVYTDGNQVTASDLALYTDDQPSTSSATFEDVGGGWTRVKTTFTGQPKAAKFGLQVKPGKTVYVDGVQLEQKAYPTTYADGSLGTGYTWTGTVHNSISSRTTSKISHNSPESFINTNSGTFSFWYKPNWIASTNNSYHFLLQSEIPGSDGLVVYVTTVNRLTLWINETSVNGLINDTNFTHNKWHHITATWDTVNNSSKIYLDGSLFASGVSPAFSLANNFNIGNSDNNAYASNGSFSDLRIFDKPVTQGEMLDLYNQGLQTHSNGGESDDRYVASGTYTSPVMDLGANGQFSNWSVTENLNGGSVNYFTRTSPDNLTWSDWSAVTGSAIASEPRKYLQWKANLTGNQASSPVISGMSVTYVEDTTVPTNPSTTAQGFVNAASTSATLASAEWGNALEPKFTFDSGSDEAAIGQSSSGINGYHVVLTKTADLVPSEHTDDPCYRWLESDARAYNTSCILTDGPYYLRVQTKDNSGNTATAVTLFEYKFDGSIPQPPASISSTTVGYSASNTFTFFWPAAADIGPSGVVGYEYKTAATEGIWSTWQYTTNTQVEGVPAYSEGQNFFIVRTVDAAGNYSGATSNNLSIAPFYYSSSAPTAPQNVVISPSTSSGSAAAENIFSVSWDKPASYSGEIAKYYYCVNCTPSESSMTETTPNETVARTLTDIALATQQGKNTFYLVAEDNTSSTTGYGNRNFEAYASVDFYATTIAPSAPTNLTISDVSDREASQWRLTLAWRQGESGGTPARYDVYRDGVKVGSTTSTAYTDADLVQSQRYSYYVKAIDNAGSSSLASNTVTQSAEGRFSDPPTTGGTPTVSIGSTTATIAWTTNRPAFGTVEYGKTADVGQASGESLAVTNHSVKLTGLASGTTYYYRLQSLDDSSLVGYERATAYSETYSFTTLNTPEITGITVSDITLDSVLVSWNTTSMATSVIDYGETTTYGLAQTVTNTASSSAHMVKLNNLKHSTTYHFKVKGTTADGAEITSEDNTFTTMTFPKVTAMVFDTDQGASGTSVVVAWSTNVPTTGTVEYQSVKVDPDARSNQALFETVEGGEKRILLTKLQSLDQSELAALAVNPVGDSKQVYSGKLESRHVMRINGLEDGSLYVITLRGRDANGLEAVSEPWRYVTGADTRPPRIENLMVETPLSGIGSEAKGQLIVSWDTDEPASGQILWGRGTGSEYPQASEKESALGTSHVIVLRDLDPTTSFHFKLTVTDAAGNTTESEDTVIVTPAAPQAALDIIFKNLSDIFGFLKL